MLNVKYNLFISIYCFLIYYSLSSSYSLYNYLIWYSIYNYVNKTKDQ
jgi:hypothetical protein